MVVGQLCAIEQAVEAFEDKLFDSPEAARKAAEKMKDEPEQS